MGKDKSMPATTLETFISVLCFLKNSKESKNTFAPLFFFRFFCFK